MTRAVRRSIRSERRLCQEVELDLAYRWFCRLDLEDGVPDHSTFSVNRHGRLNVEATPTRISKEVDATEVMIDRVEERFALKPKRIAGDVSYGTGAMLGWLVDRDITPYIPIWDKSQRQDATFSRDDFIRTARGEWLAQNIFETIEEAQDQATAWLWTYNNDRPNMGIVGSLPL